MPVSVDMSWWNSSCCFRYFVIDVDRYGDPQERDSEVDEASFEPSITRNSYSIRVTDNGLNAPGGVEAVPLHRLPLSCAEAPR